jgi:hypothetical protein
MKWPYTVNVGGVTFYCWQHVETKRREAFWDGLMMGLCLGSIFMSVIAYLVRPHVGT